MLPCAARSILSPMPYMFFFFNDTATTEIYTLSLHDALPISASGIAARSCFLESAESFHHSGRGRFGRARYAIAEDRKSTRLNSSHGYISYAVFCLKKKKENVTPVVHELVERLHYVRAVHPRP